MKKIVRKQLKEDEFVTTVNRVFRFLKKRTKELIALGIVIVSLILFFVGFKLIRAQNLQKESEVTSELLRLRQELSKNPENLAKLEEMAGKGKFSRSAYVLLATHWLEQGDFEKARASLAKMKDTPKDFFYYQAQDLLAQIYLLEKNYEKAIEMYKKIEGENQKVYPLDVVLSHLAEAHEKKGEKDAALALYKKIQDEFSQTYYGYEASQKIKK